MYLAAKKRSAAHSADASSRLTSLSHRPHAALQRGSAGAGSGYDLAGLVVASGSSIDGGDYAISGALGHPDTGTLTGGDYSLGGGFFGGGVINGGTRSSTYLPAMRR
jgi:hypothetical protein